MDNSTSRLIHPKVGFASCPRERRSECLDGLFRSPSDLIQIVNEYLETIKQRDEIEETLIQNILESFTLLLPVAPSLRQPVLLFLTSIANPFESWLSSSLLRPWTTLYRLLPFIVDEIPLGVDLEVAVHISVLSKRAHSLLRRSNYVFAAEQDGEGPSRNGGHGGGGTGVGRGAGRDRREERGRTVCGSDGGEAQRVPATERYRSRDRALRRKHGG